MCVWEWERVCGRERYTVVTRHLRRKMPRRKYSCSAVRQVRQKLQVPELLNELARVVRKFSEKDLDSLNEVCLVPIIWLYFIIKMLIHRWNKLKLIGYCLACNIYFKTSNNQIEDIYWMPPCAKIVGKQQKCKKTQYSLGPWVKACMGGNQLMFLLHINVSWGTTWGKQCWNLFQVLGEIGTHEKLYMS